MGLNEIKPSKTSNVIVWILIIPTLLGEFFKIQHWPGASILIMFGTFIFTFFYLPLFTLESWKTKETKRSKLVLLLQTIILLLFAIGLTFLIMHWPGAGFFYIINNYILLYIIAPFSLYHLALSRKKNLIVSHNILLVIYFFVHTISALLNSGSGRINIDTVLQQGLNTEEALRTASSRNKQLYANLFNVDLDKNNDVLIRAIKLKTAVDSVIIHIKDLKSHLLVIIDKIPKTQADTLSSLFIENKVDIKLSTNILIGNEYNPNKDKYSASKLKSVLNNFRDTLLSLIQEQNRTIIQEGLNLSTDNYSGEEGQPVSWEITNFNYMPLLYVFNTLTNIQYEIKNAEYQALSDIINSGNKDLNTALFSQISNLNSKYDAVKKQEEIVKLKSENEKGMELLNVKDSELSDNKQTIVYFILVIMVFLMLVFFVLRSNYLRKQINNTLLKQKVIIEIQKNEVEDQKNLVEEKQKEILDSISYAQRIQNALLPPLQEVSASLPNSFVLFKPKDIVAGDFYWFAEINNKKIIAACDCTGHGVPGAFMSTIGSEKLNEAVKDSSDVSVILNLVNRGMKKVLRQTDKINSTRDGMDVSLCAFNKDLSQVEYAGANRPLWIIRKDQLEIEEIKATKVAIGGLTEDTQEFAKHTIDLQKGDSVYLFSDGYADQFSPQDKKLMTRKFKEIILSIQNKSMEEQKEYLGSFIDEWKGNMEQTDDILVIGVRV
jgi:serine phosphatase RsbU (regulator of sigma subunit)